MRESRHRSLFLGLAGGAGVATCAAILMGQGGAQPPGPRGGDYFVTGEGTHAFLWQREGGTLRFVSQADTTRPAPTEPAKPMDPDRKPMAPPK